MASEEAKINARKTFDTEGYVKKAFWCAKTKSDFKKVREKHQFLHGFMLKHEKETEKEVKVCHKFSEVQEIRIKKLLSFHERHPEKEAFIPQKRKEFVPRPPQEFRRSVHGSSSGVGSSDFHIYRGVRRREYARQKYEDMVQARTKADQDFANSVQSDKEKNSTKTAKKRAKRLRLKANLKKQRKQTNNQGKQSEEDEDSSEDDGIERTLEDDDEDDAAPTGDDTSPSHHNSTAGEENEGATSAVVVDVDHGAEDNEGVSKSMSSSSNTNGGAVSPGNDVFPRRPSDSAPQDEEVIELDDVCVTLT